MKWKKVWLAVVIIACITALFTIGFKILDLFIDTSREIDDLKKSSSLNMPNELASKELSHEFFESYSEYGNLSNGWNVKTEMATAKLRSNSIDYDYWIFDKNADIVYSVFYDTWDWAVEECVLIKHDYKYPDPETAKVSEICFALNFANGYDKESAIKIQLTEQELEEIREFAIKKVYKEDKTKCFPKDYFIGEQNRDILWFFEDDDMLYYECGEIVRTTEGKYYLRAASSYYTVYVLSDEICDKIYTALGEKWF